jgi:hypothetical protein
MILTYKQWFPVQIISIWIPNLWPRRLLRMWLALAQAHAGRESSTCVWFANVQQRFGYRPESMRTVLCPDPSALVWRLQATGLILDGQPPWKGHADLVLMLRTA